MSAHLKYHIQIHSPLTRIWKFEEPLIHYWIDQQNLRCVKICHNINIIGVVTRYGILTYALDLSNEVDILYIDQSSIYMTKTIASNWTFIIGQFSLLLQHIIDQENI